MLVVLGIILFTRRSQSVYGKGYNGVKTEAADDTPTLPHGFER
jgi:hypothetical protein